MSENALIEENTKLKKEFNEISAKVEKLEAVARAAEFLSSTLYLMRQANSPVVAGTEATLPVFQDGVIHLLEALARLKDKA